MTRGLHSFYILLLLCPFKDKRTKFLPIYLVIAGSSNSPATPQRLTPETKNEGTFF